MILRSYCGTREDSSAILHCEKATKYKNAYKTESKKIFAKRLARWMSVFSLQRDR